MNRIQVAKELVKIAGKAISLPMEHISNSEKRRLALNKKTPPEVLAELVKDKSLRAYVAENENAPIKIMRKLLKDEDWNVRECLARNKNLPKEISSKLLKDNNRRVRDMMKFKLEHR